MRVTSGLIAALSVLLIATAGCGSAAQLSVDDHPSTGSGVAGKDQAPSNELAVPHDGAPKVRIPVNVAAFKAAPCTVLLNSQLSTLGITAKPRSLPGDPTGPRCIWNGGIGGIYLSFNFIPNSDGLSAIYRKHKSGDFEFFQPGVPVNDLPTVIALPTDSRPSGDCGYAVGFNDHDAGLIQLGERGAKDPCADARQVALSITKTVKEGGG